LRQAPLALEAIGHVYVRLRFLHCIIVPLGHPQI
jgi:hypothetical protein